MPPKYRCLVRDATGHHVAYMGPDLHAALASMERHARARMVCVERYDQAWGGYWRCVQGLWR